MLLGNGVSGGLDGVRKILDLLQDPVKIRANLDSIAEAETRLRGQYKEHGLKIDEDRRALDQRRKELDELELRLNNRQTGIAKGESELKTKQGDFHAGQEQARAGLAASIDEHKGKISAWEKERVRLSAEITEGKIGNDLRAKELDKALTAAAAAETNAITREAEAERLRQSFTERLKKLKEITSD